MMQCKLVSSLLPMRDKVMCDDQKPKLRLPQNEGAHHSLGY